MQKPLKERVCVMKRERYAFMFINHNEGKVITLCDASYTLAVRVLLHSLSNSLLSLSFRAMTLFFFSTKRTLSRFLVSDYFCGGGSNVEDESVALFFDFTTPPRRRRLRRRPHRSDVTP